MADSGVVCSMSRSGNVWDNAALGPIRLISINAGSGFADARYLIARTSECQPEKTPFRRPEAI